MSSYSVGRGGVSASRASGWCRVNFVWLLVSALCLRRLESSSRRGDESSRLELLASRARRVGRRAGSGPISGRRGASSVINLTPAERHLLSARPSAIERDRDPTLRRTANRAQAPSSSVRIGARLSPAQSIVEQRATDGHRRAKSTIVVVPPVTAVHTTCMRSGVAEREDATQGSEKPKKLNKKLLQ